MQRLKHYSYTQEEKALLRRLAGFTTIYKQACQTFLETAAEKYPQATYDREVPSLLTVRAAIQEDIPDGWDDIKALIEKPYKKKETWWCHYYLNAIEPRFYDTVDAFRDWWKQTYLDHLDYSYPPAPDPLPTEVIKVNQRTYRIGQFELRFLNDQRFRNIETWVKAGRIDTYYESVNLRDLPRTIHTVFVPRVLPLLALCDWDQLGDFTPQQKEALSIRCHEIKRSQKGY